MTRGRHLACTVSTAVILAWSHSAAGQESLLHAMFQDHAVVQRGQPVKVWGRASRDDEITVSLAGVSASARSDASGNWSVTLPALRAGGPHSLHVRTASGRHQSVDNVLIGDVWLCSGQSNMVLQMHRALDSRAEIANATNDSLRIVTIALAADATPREAFETPVEWRVAQPETVRDFSATCYYFARELQKVTGAPMGLVNASWGGSRIEAWMSERAIRATGIYDDALDVLSLYRTDREAADRRWGEMWEQWWQSRVPAPEDMQPWQPGGIKRGEWRQAPPSLGVWEEWGVSDLAEYDGMLWHRTGVELTQVQASQSAVLVLGRVDEVDQTWVNGEPVGNTSGPDAERRYALAPGRLQPGQNVIVVNALDTYGSGGLSNGGERRRLEFADGTSISLDGEWHYQLAPPNIGPAPRAPWEATGGLTTIHNAMIAPLGSYGFRGVVWYQGESNTEHAERYQMLLEGFMADWRARFGADLPFLIVQLANYGPPPTQPVESGWARVREAQRQAVARDSHAGLAVTIDIGDRYDIHPANKQEVGRRLARAARHVILGERIAPSGPVPRGAHREGSAIVVTFEDVEQGLASYSSQHPTGFELCGPEAGSCRFAVATLDGNRIILDAQDVPTPVRVRFCWADSPVCTLYDRSGLPAGPFEIPIG